MVYPFSLSKSKLVLLHAVLHEYTLAEPSISAFKPINRPLKTDCHYGTIYNRLLNYRTGCCAFFLSLAYTQNIKSLNDNIPIIRLACIIK